MCGLSCLIAPYFSFVASLFDRNRGMNSKKHRKPPVSFPIKPPGPPKVWKVVDTVIKGKGNTPVRFSIQEVPEDMYDEVVDYMCKYFIPEEPMCKCSNGKDDPEFVETFRTLWAEVVRHGLSVVALTENPDGGKPIIAAANILVLSYEGEDLDFVNDMPIKPRRIMEAILKVSKNAQVYKKYGVDRYIAAFGLSVHPSFRGAALGGYVLRTREDIGREYKLSITSTAFTSPISQKLAERSGFETLIEQKYEDMVDDKGNPLFPGIEAKSVKLMAKKLY